MSRIFKNAEELSFDNSSRLIIMSDCHRGDGSEADDFAKNQNLYYAALTYYEAHRFTYIELGDGDELWENSKFSDILHVHSDVFWLLKKFFDSGRLYMMYGNHDIIKRRSSYMVKNNRRFVKNSRTKECPLPEKLPIYEAFLLKHKETSGKIFLLHGHQVDFLNNELWPVACFLVRYLWRPLELFGVTNPTSPAVNHKRKKKVEIIISDWAAKKKQMTVVGHTHRPVFPEPYDPPYYNDGCCVHPRCITGLEIESGSIALVKWSVKTKPDGTLYVGRDRIAGPRRLEDAFNTAAFETP